MKNSKTITRKISIKIDGRKRKQCSEIVKEFAEEMEKFGSTLEQMSKHFSNIKKMYLEMKSKK